METWRDTTSTPAQDDLDSLLTAAIDFAEQRLAEHGVLLPFAAAVSAGGEIDILALDPDENDQPEPEEVLADLVAAAQETASSGRAAAFVSDVLLEDDQDALRIEMEHREGVTFEIFLPYTRDAEALEITFGEMVATDGEARLWGVEQA